MTFADKNSMQFNTSHLKGARGTSTTTGHGPQGTRGTSTTTGHGPQGTRGTSTTTGHSPIDLNRSQAVRFDHRLKVDAYQKGDAITLELIKMYAVYMYISQRKGHELTRTFKRVYRPGLLIHLVLSPKRV